MRSVPQVNSSGSAHCSQKSITVLIVDDHPVVRKGLISALGLQTVHEAADGEEALAKARQLSPDVVLMDIDLPKMDGLAVTKILHQEKPAIKVVLLSMHSMKIYGRRIIQSGACGYLSKQASPKEFVNAVEAAVAGGRFFGQDVTPSAPVVDSNPKELSLSARERQVLTEIATGWTNKEIASHLGVGVRTVETHREHIIRKLNIHSIAGLTRFAIIKGLIAVPLDTQESTQQSKTKEWQEPADDLDWG